jgi:hypothetical protein
MPSSSHSMMTCTTAMYLRENIRDGESTYTYEMDRFIAYKGDPLHRKKMDFLIRFGDGSELWMPWSWDLFQTVQYESFCSSNPELRLVIYSAQKAKSDIMRLKQSVISEVNPGNVVFVDLRSYGADWYDTLDIPDKYLIKYLAEYRYLDFLEAKTRIRCHCPVFNEYFVLDRDLCSVMELVALYLYHWCSSIHHSAKNSPL